MVPLISKGLRDLCCHIKDQPLRLPLNHHGLADAHALNCAVEVLLQITWPICQPKKRWGFYQKAKKQGSVGLFFHQESTRKLPILRSFATGKTDRADHSQLARIGGACS